MLSKLNPQEMIGVLRRDAWHHRRALAAVFAVVLVTLPLIGGGVPKQYTSSTTIYVEERNILGPLMKGTAVQGEVADRARVAQEMISGRKLMAQVLRENGFIGPQTTAKEKEALINAMVARTEITNRGKNLIHIEYSDGDPERAAAVTQDLAEQFIAASHEAKVEESQAAYDFITEQVREYETSLAGSEGKLKSFIESESGARPGADVEVARRVADLRTREEQIAQELREARILASTLEQQLSAKASSSAAQARTQGLRARESELLGRLADLRLSYTDEHPDVRRTERQLANVRAQIQQVQSSPASAGSNVASAGGGGELQTVLGDLERESYRVNAEIETLESRLAETRERLDEESGRQRQISAVERKLSGLERDFEMNENFHRDLLQRREMAKVSLDLARAGKGITLRIDEPAHVPQRPSGLQPIHFIAAAPLLALAFPFGAVVALNQFDPRVRHSSLLVREFQLHDVIEIPQHRTRWELLRQQSATVAAVLIAAAGIGGFIVASLWINPGLISQVIA